MASNTPVDTSVDYSVFGEELPTLSPAAQDVYGCLLNNGIYAFQPNSKMDVNIVKAALGCYFGIARSVYIQSSQVAYVDVCPGNELTSPGFHWFFFTGIHTASFPDNPTHDCNVVFNPLVEMIRSDQLYTMAAAIVNTKSSQGWIFSTSIETLNGILIPDLSARFAFRRWFGWYWATIVGTYWFFIDSWDLRLVYI